MFRFFMIFLLLGFMGCTAESPKEVTSTGPVVAEPESRDPSERNEGALEAARAEGASVVGQVERSPTQVVDPPKPAIKPAPGDPPRQPETAKEAPVVKAVPVVESSAGSGALGVDLSEGVESLKLLNLAVGLSVEDRNPVGVATRFDTIPPRFHCHSTFDSRLPETTVIHTWRRAGRVVSRVELEVKKSPSWRTWSRQRIRAEWADRWSCTVTSDTGALLGVATFEVEAPGATPEPDVPPERQKALY
jgi:hypothetical protein